MSVDDMATLLVRQGGQMLTMKAEIERLRDRNNLLEAQNDVLRKTLQDYTAALERLRAALHWTVQNCLDGACVRQAMAALRPDQGLRASKRIASGSVSYQKGDLSIKG